MIITRSVRFAGLALVGALALSACGSDNGTSTTPTGGSTGSGPTTAALSGTLNAEGSSAQKNAIDAVVADYTKANAGVTVNYNPTGSGAGIKQFIGAQVDFGGSDSALKTVAVAGVVEQADADKRCGNPAWNLPMVIGPVAVVFNVPGVTALTLNGDVIAKIYKGKVKTWNDPAIAALNSGVTLPATAIKPFYRSDSSGTTDNFTKYLHAAAPTVWTDANAKLLPAGTAGEGREKSSGVAEGVKGAAGGIGYVEWSYAASNSLSFAKIDNGGGPVELTADTVSAAIGTATQVGTGNDLSLKFDYATKAAGVYPIVLVTYEIVCSKGLTPEKTALVKSFLSFFASPAEQAKLTAIQYAPLPAALQAKVATAIDAIS